MVAVPVLRRGPSAARGVLLLLHRWSGLIAGLWLFVAAVTGSIMVFTDEIDRALNPELFYSAPGQAAPADDIVASVMQAFPGYFPNSIDLPDAPGDSAIVFTRPLPDSGMPRVSREIFVDPVSAQVIGMRDRDALEFSRPGFTRLVIKLHYTMLAGKTGQWIFGLVALFWLVGHVVGVILAFPSRKDWRSSFTIPAGAKGYRFHFRSHRALSLWFLPVTAMLALSAVYLNWNSDFRWVAASILPTSQGYDQTAERVEEDYSPPVGLQQAIDIAARAVPGQSVDGVSLMPDKGLYRVRLFDRLDIDPTSGRRYVYVDNRTGAVRANEHIAEAASGDLFLAWQFPLHSGKVFGWPGRIVIFVTGIMICFFVVTGYVIYFRKRAARKHIRCKPVAAPLQTMSAE